MISLPLVYTILALIAYTTSFWYLFSHLMSKRAPNHWFIGVVLGLGMLLHAGVLYNDMLTPMGVNYDVFNLMSFTSGLMLLLSVLFSTYRPVLAMNLLGIPVAATGLIFGFAFSQTKSIYRTTFTGFRYPYYFVAFRVCRPADGNNSSGYFAFTRP